MTSFSDIELKCALCGARSDHLELASTNTFGPPDLDLRPPEMRRSTMLHWLQRCPSCSLVAEDIEHPPPAAERILRSDAYLQILADEAIPELSRVFQCHALICEADGEFGGAFQWMLAAAWVADDANMSDLAIALRLKAVAYFDQKQDVIVDEKFRLLDVLRRSGSWARADELIERLASEITEKYPRQILEFQSVLIEERNMDCARLPPFTDDTEQKE